MSTKSVISGFLADVMSMKSKRALAMVGIMAAFSVGMKEYSFLLPMVLITGLFFREDNGRFAVLFAPISKKCSVVGRYLLALVVTILLLFFNLLADLIAPVFSANYVQGSMQLYIMLGVASISLISIITPWLYFFGYKWFQIINLILMLATFSILSSDRGQEFLLGAITGLNTNLLLAPSMVVASLALMLCSMILSVRAFKRREL
jgi:hypothetical protein